MIRWWLQRRAAAAIRWASGCVADVSDRGHVLRLAYLREGGGSEEVAFEDRGEVRAAFEKAVSSAPRAPRLWTATIVMAAALLAVAGAFVWVRLSARRFDPRATPVGQALGPDLTEYAARVSHTRALVRHGDPPEDDFTSARDRAQATLTTALGPETGGALIDLFRAYQTAALDPSAAMAGFRELTAEIQRFNGALTRARQPYLLDFFPVADGEPMLTSYYVGAERGVRASGSSIRVLYVQRLDSINRIVPLLGYTRPTLGAALVVLDLLERDLVTVIMPALREGAGASLVDSTTRDDGPRWVGDLEQRMGAVLRSDAQPVRSSAIDRLVALLARRDDLFWQFAAAAYRVNLRAERPSRLVAPEVPEALGRLLAPSAVREWREINAELDTSRLRAAFDQVLGVFADQVERHELQHQLDFRAGLMAVPHELRAMFGLSDDAPVDVTGNVASCRDELSAYLAQIARSADHAATNVALVSRAAFDRNLWGTPHSYAAAVVLPALSGEFGGPEGKLIRGGAIDRALATDMILAVTARPGGEIARAAASVYGKLFGSDLPSFEPSALVKARSWWH